MGEHIIMVLCCCGNNNHQVDDPEDGAGGPEVGEGGEARERGTRYSVNKMFYSRIGRVEKFKHGSTVMFLGKAVVLSTIILLLVQFIANTETCYLHTGVDKLPSHLQKILLDKYKTNSLRCPYNDKFDVSYTFNLAD